MTSKGEKGILTLYSDVQATSVRWLWYPFIAVGKITLLQGDPGDGKSTMMMNLIAELSKGGKLPDGKAVGLSQRVIYQCSEDGVSDTIKPRLEKCGADCGNVAFINEETYSGLTLDDERIRQAIIEFRPRLVVIDPIQAYLGSDSDLQIAGRARKLMQRLGMWASVYDCAIVLIGHLNKKEGTRRSWGTRNGIRVRLPASLQMNAIVGMCWRERLSHQTSLRTRQRRTTMIERSTVRGITTRQSFPEMFSMRPIICAHPGRIKRKIIRCLF